MKMKLGVSLKMDGRTKMEMDKQRSFSVGMKTANKIALGMALMLCASLGMAEEPKTDEKESSQGVAKDGVGQTTS